METILKSVLEEASIFNHLIDSITNEAFIKFLQSSLIKSVIVILIGYLLIRITNNIVKRILTRNSKNITRKQETIINMLQNFVRYFIWFIVAMAVLNAFGVNTNALLASAGVLGVALGFGAQSLVKDVISGLFIILEDQFSIGDVIETNGFMGEVVSIGLKTTRVKKWTGEVKIVANGNIGDVINYSKNNAVSVVDLDVNVDTDLEKVATLLEEELPLLKERHEQIISLPEYLGVIGMKDNRIQLRITAETLPMQQYAVQRLIFKEIKMLFDQHNIGLAVREVLIRKGDSNG